VGAFHDDRFFWLLVYDGASAITPPCPHISIFSLIPSLLTTEAGLEFCHQAPVFAVA
jgi:hypothetical protein